jgi:hypothetical protein
MSGHDHGDCGYDYNRSWDYDDCQKPRRHARRSRRRSEDCWSYGTFS